MLIGDPIALFIAYSQDPPSTQVEGAVYTSGNGVYYGYHANTGWTMVSTILADEFLAGLTEVNEYAGAILALQKLLTMLNPVDYIQSFTAGGQSTSFASFADCLAWYDRRKQYIAEIARKLGTRTRAFRRPAPVGGVYD